MTVAAVKTLPKVDVRPERPQDDAVVNRLIADAFGPGRFTKSADRLREGRHPRRDLSLIAWDGDKAAGCVRLWPIHIGGAPAILLGPFAVDTAYRHRGLGAALIEAACRAAEAAGEGLIFLVGEASFFVRLGFDPAPKGRVSLPGPVDPNRLFWKALRPGALDGVAGAVTI